MADLITVLYNEPVSAEEDPSETDVLDQVGGVTESLLNLGIPYTTLPIVDQIAPVIETLLSRRPEAVFNLCECISGQSGLEMNAPALLEILGIPYTGSPPLSLGLCQRKDLAKAVLAANGIPTPSYRVMTTGEEDLPNGLRFPLIVKPVQEDGSIGITGESVVKNPRELRERVKHIVSKYRQPALVEEYIDGRELNVALLGNDPPNVLPVSEILFRGEENVVSFDAKWLRPSRAFEETSSVCPAELDSRTQRRIEDIAFAAYRLLRCRDYARVDIRLAGETPYVLEVNPNPDISPEAGYARSLRAAGLSMEGFVERVVGYALSRGKRLSGMI